MGNTCVKRGINWKMGIIQLLLGVFMFIGGYIDKRTILIILGSLISLYGINIISLKYIPMGNKVRVFLDGSIGIMSIAIIMYGYLSTGDFLLMIMLILLIILPIIMFILRKLIYKGITCQIYMFKR